MKTPTLIRMTDKHRATLKDLGGNTIGFNEIYCFFEENIDLYREQLIEKEWLSVAPSAEMGITYTCSACDKKSPSNECLMIKWDATGETVVGICKTCKAGMKKRKMKYVCDYSRVKK